MDYNKLYMYLSSNDMLDFYKDALITNNSRNLPYHSSTHMENVAVLAMEGCEYYSISGDILKCVVAACLLHDYNHSGGKLKDDTLNIELALEGTLEITTKYPQIFNNDDIKIIYNIIKSTRYPYIVEVSELPLYIQVVLDSDILQSFLYKPYTSILRGLSEEMGVDFDSFISSQNKFIDSLVPHTEWGKVIFDKNKESIKEIIKFFSK